MNREHRESMSKIAKDIVCFKFRLGMTLKEVEKGFHDLMRKHGIKYGTKHPGETGVTYANFEWTLCRDLYYNRLRDWLTIRGFLVSVPKDLKYYKIGDGQ